MIAAILSWWRRRTRKAYVDRENMPDDEAWGA